MQPLLDETWAESPVVFLTGPRQSGKSTLVQALAARQKIPYVTFDDYLALEEATQRPEAFLEAHPAPIIFDEIQRVPQLFLGIKKRVDHARAGTRRASGMYLLTGSSSIESLPCLAEALVGRLRILHLHPLSAAEQSGKRAGFLDWAFGTASSAPKTLSRGNTWEQAAHSATFPEIALNKKLKRSSWFQGYVGGLLQRELRDIAEIDRPTSLPPLLQLLAARSAQILNESSLASSLGMPLATLRRYRALLDALHLSFTLPSWQRNLGKRLIHAPKAYVADGALQWHLLGRDPASFKAGDPTQLGMLAETFVTIELRRQVSLRPAERLFHFRTAMGKEVDLVVERSDGRIIAIEVKAQPVLRSEDFSGLRELAALAGKSLQRGIVLYLGKESRQISDRLWMAPIQTLWETPS